MFESWLGAVNRRTEASALEGARPGPALAAALVELDVAAADDAVLVESIAAWERTASWALARQAVAVNELRRRREAQRRAAFVGDEVAARLGVTRAAGELTVSVAWCLERVPAVWDALDRGDVDARKARVLVEEILALPAEAAAGVTADVVPEAPDLTVPQIRLRIRRAALELDPDAAARAHRRARADRHVELFPARDGMAWLSAFLPADEAVAVHTALTALADAAAPDDPRPMDARRADALVDLVARWLDAGTAPDGTPLPRRQHRYPHLQVTASLRTLLGLDEAPGELAGYGPIPAPMAREIAARAAWTPVLVDERTGEVRAIGTERRPAGRAGPAPGYRPPAQLAAQVTARDVTCTFPGCRVPATRCDIDHLDPFDPTRPAETQTVEPNLHALCRHHHLLKTHGGWQVEREEGTGRTRWTTPAGLVRERRSPPL